MASAIARATDADPWWKTQNAEPLDDAAFQLRPDEASFFKSQTGIDDDAQLKQHILDVQRKAYTVWPYPCIRRMAFLKLKISRLPAYERALALGPSPSAILVDLGCCFGSDTRKAVADGFPASQVLASDLRAEFWTLGHELFRSSPEAFPVRFVQGDVFDDAFFDPAAPPLAAVDAIQACAEQHSLMPLRRRASAVHASALFHLFNEAQQRELARRIEALLSFQPGSVAFGWQAGARTPQGMQEGRDAWRHSPESWKTLWAEIVTDGSVRVEAELRNSENDVVETTGAAVSTQDGEWLSLVWSVTRI
ncbi:hypothetical protein AURDEDRAFT_115549 [Auricularia subglabra TFB-10046 SS5]|nr:hypothetical protein AURDEDRAFT_115549 [Auricularia subglabra TFB-10046 SS5]